MNEIKEDIES